MQLSRMSLLLLILVSLVAVAGEGGWQGSMQDGSQVTIDPTTNKATRTLDGESSPLWNGVHQLSNGAVIIVREGVVVRDAAIIEAQHEQARDQLNAACMQLVKKVCGSHNECLSHAACEPARQLLAMEREELNGSWSGAVMESSTLCLEALGNEAFFQACPKHQPGNQSTNCERLMTRVCGEDNQCESSQGCDAARQLVGMELQDRFKGPGPSAASRQCRDVLANESPFFQVCE